MYKMWIGMFAILAISACSMQQNDPKSKSPASVGVPREYVMIEVFGMLKADVVAIGGETTGYTVTARGQTWELDFHKDDALILIAKKLHGQLALVSGAPELRRYAERGIVPTIRVDEVREGEGLLPPKK